MSKLVRTERKVVQLLVDRVPISDYCTWLNAEDMGEYCLFETTEGMGFIFEISVPNFLATEFEKNIKSVFTMSYPENTMIHFFCFSSSNLKVILERYRDLHRYKPNVDNPDILLEIIDKRVEFYERAIHEGFWPDVKLKPRLLRNFVSFHVPFKTYKGDLVKTFDVTKELAVKVRSLLMGIGLNPSKIDGSDLRTLLKEIFGIRYQGFDFYDEKRFLKNQIIDTTQRITFKEDYDDFTDLHFKNGKDKEKFVRLYSVTGFPKQMDLWTFSNLLFKWDDMDILPSIPGQFGFSLQVKMADWEKVKARVMKKALWNINQAENNALAKYIPKITKRAHEAQYIIDLIEEGAIPLEAYYSVFFVGDDQKDLDNIDNSVISRFRKVGFEMQRETDKALLGLFLESLPLNEMEERGDFLKRRSTLFDTNIASMIPLVGGIGSSKILNEIYVDRKGNIVFFDRFDSPTNYNVTKIAESGGGKSFSQTNSHVHSLTMGRKIRVLDIGRSYMNFCKDIGGEFIEIADRVNPDGTVSRPCFNFFTNMLTDENGNIHEDEMDSIVPLVGFLCGLDISQQISDSGDNTNARYASIIMTAVEMAWKKKGREAGLADVAYAFKEMEDETGDNLPKKLYQAIEPYALGTYAHYFNGRNNIDYSKDYVVLELEEIEQKDARLQAAIIFSLIVKILREVYLDRNDNRQVEVDIDEAWSIFEKVTAKSFINSAARRFRKYNGSLCVITQGVDDMYSTPTTIAIWENSAHRIYLKMKAESIEKAIKDNRLTMSEFEKEWFKTLSTHAGKFSEVFFNTPVVYGILRLIVDRYSYGIFTTKASERGVIQQLADQHGMTYGQVLKALTEQVPIGHYLKEAGVPELVIHYALVHQEKYAKHKKIGEILQEFGVPAEKIEEALHKQRLKISWEQVIEGKKI